MKHGQSGKWNRTRAYKAWAAMKTRCLNQSCREWPSYGGRGIKVCEKWLDFEGFIADMGRVPIGRSLDRIDNNGNYEPGNCRWATREEQQNNLRSNVFISAFGRTLTRAKWAKEVGISPNTLKHRLKFWPPETALNAVAWHNRYNGGGICGPTNSLPITAFGKTLSLSQWGRELGISQGTLKERLRRGWPIAAALTTPLKVNRWAFKSLARHNAA